MGLFGFGKSNNEKCQDWISKGNALYEQGKFNEAPLLTQSRNFSSFDLPNPNNPITEIYEFNLHKHFQDNVIQKCLRLIP